MDVDNTFISLYLTFDGDTTHKRCSTRPGIGADPPFDLALKLGKTSPSLRECGGSGRLALPIRVSLKKRARCIVLRGNRDERTISALFSR